MVRDRRPAIEREGEDPPGRPRHGTVLQHASVWEIAIKTSLGKLTLRKPVEEFLPAQLAANRFNVLNIATEHAFRVARLPMHHRDPFDRMLVAQRLAENLPLVSSDDALDAYNIKRLW